MDIREYLCKADFLEIPGSVLLKSDSSRQVRTTSKGSLHLPSHNPWVVFGLQPCKHKSSSVMTLVVKIVTIVIHLSYPQASDTHFFL